MLLPSQGMLLIHWTLQRRMGKYFRKESVFAVVLFFSIHLLLVVCHGMNLETHASVSCHQHEREALIKFKTGLVDANQKLASWGNISDCCKWGGITCDNQTGYVLQLNFSVLCDTDGVLDNDDDDYRCLNLSGKLDPALLELKHLQFLELSYNNGFFGTPIPSFLGSFKELKYLNLSHSGFKGEIPHQLGNLSKVEYLDLTTDDYYLYRLQSDQLQWLKGMTSLKHLKMDSVDLSKTGTSWIHSLSTLPLLSELHLSNCDLRNLAQPLSSYNFTSLRILDLSQNHFGDSILALIGNISNIESINLAANEIQGPVPYDLKELSDLHLLDLSRNNITINCSNLLGGGWRSIKTISLSQNKINGEIPCSVGNLTSLVHLDMSFNLIVGKFPNCIEHLASLERLELRGNKLHGPIPTTFGKLSKLQYASMGYNSLTGILNETHFEELRSLKWIDISMNELVLNMQSNWIPPFQLDVVLVRSCTLGPNFPQWLRTQKSLRLIDFSNTSLEGSLPSWFWNFTSQLIYLDMSHNRIEGQLPNELAFDTTFGVDFSSNLFSGPLPRLGKLFNLEYLYLSDNQFTGPIPENFTVSFSTGESDVSLSRNLISGTIPSWIGKWETLEFLDLSHNHLSGTIPMNLGNCSNLGILDLSWNHLLGGVPWSFGQLKRLSSLHLNQNTLSGKLPLSLRNCSWLKLLDLGENSFSGNIKPLISNSFTDMIVLRLRSNKFTDEIPSNMSCMSSLQIFDVSNNYLSGVIPRSLGNLTAITGVKRRQRGEYYWVRPDWLGPGLPTDYYIEHLSLLTKAEMLEYSSNLDLVTIIDLSSNEFYGPIPDELMRLAGLFFLNLSNNHLTGKIPWNIGSLESLESLDVSNNYLTGEIPISLSRLSSLSKLNLSNNNLQGKIPSGNQLQTLDDPSIYSGNRDLCGAPLAKNCSENETITVINENEDGAEHDEVWFYMSMILGFVVGFWGICGTLIFKKSFRVLYFGLFDGIGDKIYVLILLAAAKLKNNRDK